MAEAKPKIRQDVVDDLLNQFAKLTEKEKKEFLHKAPALVKEKHRPQEPVEKLDIKELVFESTQNKKKKLLLTTVDHHPAFRLAHGNKQKSIVVVPKSREIWQYTSNKEQPVKFSVDDLESIKQHKLQFKNTSVKVEFPTKLDQDMFGRLVWMLQHQGKLNSATSETVKLFIGTWNAGNASPEGQPLDRWIQPEKGHDIIVVGTQECTWGKQKKKDGEKDPQKLSASEKTSKEGDWFGILHRAVGIEGYELIEKKTMWQIKLAVFVKKTKLHNISKVERSSEATGIANVGKNKGGCGITFNYLGTSFCFITAHLAAHQGNIKDRNTDVKEIIRNIDLQDDLTTAFDHVFWFGDLNYRIDMERGAVLEHCAANPPFLEPLLPHDQLIQERKKGRLLCNFAEGPIAFKPTYKFDPMKPHTVYSDDKERIPSWCDRILWASRGQNIQQREYNACYDVITSDHVPVYSTFDVSVPYPSVPLTKSHHTVAIYDISMHDVAVGDLDGKSDPYIKFTGPGWTVDKPMTKIKHHTLNPIYSDIISLQPLSGDLHWLKEQFLHLRIMDFDADSVNDDHLGRVIMSLKDLSKVPTEFNFPILLRGTTAGTIKFKALLVKNKSHQKKHVK